MNIIVFRVSFLFLLFNFVATGFAAPLLIHDSAYGTDSRTQNILTNLAYIDSLPFDGITINIPATWGNLAPGNVASYSGIYTGWLEPLKGKLKKVTHNYVKMVVRLSADPFDDWTQTIQNWVVLAEACRDAGLEGIFFDNEEYYEQVWHYPADMKYASTETLAEYQTQFQLRGQQVMNAILAQWPACRIVHAHGPYFSESRTPLYVTLSNGNGLSSDLRGDFFSGMFAAAPGQIIDGGEVYAYRTPSDFSNSYQWRKTSQAQLVPNAVIPASLASTWMAKVSISYGCYDQPWPSGYTMSPAVFQSDITNALHKADYLVWTYSDVSDYLTPGKVAQSWITAIADARAAVASPTPTPQPTPTATPSPSPTATPTPEPTPKHHHH